MIRQQAEEVLARLMALRAFFESSPVVTHASFDRFISESRAREASGLIFIWLPADRTGGLYAYPRSQESQYPREYWERPAVLDAMRRAAASGKLAAVEDDGGNEPASDRSRLTVLAAIHGTSAARSGQLKGYVAAMLPIANLTEQGITHLAPGGIDVTVTDGAPGGLGRILHFHPSRMGGRRTRPQDNPQFRFSAELDIAGRRIMVVCDAAPQYVRNGYSSSSWIILILGVLAASLLAWWLRDRIGHTARVERLVDRRTRELAAARDEAQQSSKLKSQFLANVSHEVRTPLNAIVGMSGLLLDTPIGGEQREFAVTIRDSSMSLLSIVNDLLDMSRIEAGKLTLSPGPMDVGEVARGALDAVRESGTAKGLALSSQIAAGVPPRLIGDAGRVRQVLVNLLHNAVKFTEAGKVELRVTVESEDAEHIALRFEVEDSGIGVPLEQQEFIFRRFSQVDGSHARRHGGLGLGLAICREITSLMNGGIGVISPGQGSTFWFTARFQRVADSAINHQTQETRLALSRAGGKDLPCPEALILLVEDNRVNRRIAGHMLSNLGYTFHEATNGREALAAAERFEFAAILMDCQMPVVDGYEATRLIRDREGASRRTPIIALTANAMTGDRERCLSIGMDDYVSKPFQLEVLAAVLRRWATSPSQGRPVQEPG
jgi:signal transduction histidine kinase/ActR/RegA family two-component response regulator